MKNINTLILCILLGTVSLLNNRAWAQTGGPLVRGTILDADTKEPLIGVVVMEIDKDQRVINGANTDLSGKFALRTSNPNNSLRISYIGYVTVTRPIGTATDLNIQLRSDATTLGAVEVVGQTAIRTGMLEVAERDLTTAIARIDARELAEVQATSIDQALQGRLAGVDIVANSGDPGAGMAIRIRGTSSINQGSDPLVVVDGMPYDISVPADFNFATADEQGYAQLLNIAPSDIKDIAVLKDAAATAMWGPQASNGVLVINTKRGAKGKPTVNYMFKGVVSKQPDPIPMLSGDQYSMLIPEAFMNVRGVPLNPIDRKEFQYDPYDAYWYHNYSNNTDWIDEITRIGHQQDHNISLQGGGDRATYFASLGYNRQTGTTIGTDLSRINARINLDYRVSERIKFRTDLSYSHVDNNMNYTNNIRDMAYRKMPNMSVIEYDEFGRSTGNYFSPDQNAQGRYSSTYNPVAMAKTGMRNNTGDRIRPTFQLQYDLIPSRLYTSFDVAFDINNSKTTTFLPQTATGLPSTDARVNLAEDSDNDRFNVQTKTNIIYTPQLGENHNLQALFSLQTNDDRNVNYFARSYNTASVFFRDPTAPSRLDQDNSLGSGMSQNRNVGAVLNAQYSLLDRYIINGGVRLDGNSKFNENYRYGVFPSISGRWRVSGESFMEDISQINDFSLRASWGSTGNPPRAPYPHFGLYSSDIVDNYMGMAGIVPRTLELRNLKWETVIQANYGLNLRAFDNRLELDAEIYRKRTLDLFYGGLPIPTISGFNQVDMNVGTMDNDGWEIMAGITPIRTKDLTVRFDINVARNYNIIQELSEYVERRAGNPYVNGSYLAFIQEGNPFGSFYGYRYKGVYKDEEATVARDKDGNAIHDANGNPIQMQFNYPTSGYIFQPGDAIYEDINHDGNINYMDIVYLGNANPKLTGGFGPNITWRNLRLNVFCNYRYGYQIVNLTKYETENMTSFNNQSTAVLRRWRDIGDETEMPRAVLGPNFNSLGSDRFVEDGSFIRIKYITLRYSLPAAFANQVKVKDLSFFSTIENVYTFTGYTGQDPEVSYGGGMFQVGYDRSRTPPVKTFTLGLNARF